MGLLVIFSGQTLELPKGNIDTGSVADRLVGRQANRSAADGRLPRLPNVSHTRDPCQCQFQCLTFPSGLIGGLGVPPDWLWPELLFCFDW